MPVVVLNTIGLLVQRFVVEEVMVAVGAALTVTVFVPDVPVKPAPSVAIALIDKVAADIGVYVIEYGELLSDPSDVVPLKNSTLDTETSSVAVAVSVMAVPTQAVDPLVGAVNVTVGG